MQLILLVYYHLDTATHTCIVRPSTPWCATDQTVAIDQYRKHFYMYRLDVSFNRFTLLLKKRLLQVSLE